MSDGKRLFVGVRVSVATANNLAQAAETLARRARDAGIDVRWVAPVNYHITLKFLGWTRLETIGAVRDALEAAAAGTQRLTVRTARVGAFPSLEKANVVWAGVEDAGGLTALAKRIDEACSRLGFACERRAFHAHVTLGRLRETRPLREVVLPMSEQMFGDTKIDSVTLFESETKSSGSVYRDVHRITFKTGQEPAISASERQSRALELDQAHPSSEPDTDDGWPRGQGPNHDL